MKPEVTFARLFLYNRKVSRLPACAESEGKIYDQNERQSKALNIISTY
jgi:hypothetical protein